MRRARGFTLIELMIAVAVVALLSAIAYPSYTSYATRARRSDAQQLMTLISLRESQYMLDARTYTEKLGSNGLNIAKDGWTCGDTNCTNEYYTVTVALPDPQTTPPSYTITAAPKSGTSQAGDGDQTLSSAGAKTGKW
jgi:type IV pilus assembly protein PilE